MFLGFDGACIATLLHSYEGRKVHHIYLLSDQLRIMASLDFETAVVGPEIDRICYAGHTALVHLSHCEPSRTILQSALCVPCLQPLFQQSQTPNPRTSSNNRRTRETWRGSGRRCPVLLRWLEGWSFDLNLLRGIPKLAPTFPMLRNHLDSRAARARG